MVFTTSFALGLCPSRPPSFRSVSAPVSPMGKLMVQAFLAVFIRSDLEAIIPHRSGLPGPDGGGGRLAMQGAGITQAAILLNRDLVTTRKR